jgi:hypothetical protein
MPNIKKAEHDGLKDLIRLLELKLSSEKLFNEDLIRALRDQQHETEKWKRYYDAVRETFRVEEDIQIPGCFSPMDTVKYIVKKQEEANNESDNLACKMP